MNLKSFLISIVLAFSTVYLNAQSSKKSNCELGVDINPNYSKAVSLDSIMKRYTTNALPGVAIAVYSETESWWAGAQGYANLENKIPMQNCHLQYAQSVTKTYLAVEMLQLTEQGKINLDAPITKYLPERYSRYITNAAKITVRMLLNQTSGVPEYNINPGFVSKVIQHPLDNFSAEDCV